MRRNKVLLVFVLSEIIIYTFFLSQRLNNINLSNIWFSLALIFISFYALLYSLFYKLDSMTLIGFFCITIGISSCVQSIYNYGFIEYYPIYIFCIGFSHFSVFVLFRQNIHFKIFAFLTVVGILIAGYKLKYLDINEFISILVILSVGILVNVCLRLRKNLRRK